VDNEPLITLAPISISLLALIVSAISLGWNIYRDVLLKPRVRVRLQMGQLHHPTFDEPVTSLILSATNHGPGPVKCITIKAKEAQWWRRLRHSVKHAVIMPDWTNPLSGKLPASLDVGNQVDLMLPWDTDSFVKYPFTHVGLSDTYGRIHWARRRDISQARRQWRDEFGQSAAMKKPGAPAPHQP
jgi:hypothetical protein